LSEALAVVQDEAEEEGGEGEGGTGFEEGAGEEVGGGGGFRFEEGDGGLWECVA
jgi:hypothetical protein